MRAIPTAQRVARRLRLASAPPPACTRRVPPSAAMATRHLCAGAGDGSGKPPPPSGLLARLLAPPRDGARNPLLAALGYYSAESRAIGAGNALYAQARARADAAATAEAGDDAAQGFAPRFEMLSVHVYLTLRRLRAEKGSVYEAEVKTVMQCLFDVFWTDVRGRMLIKERGMKLIESGKWVKECEQRFFGMALAFDEAWGDDGKMRDVIGRNLTCLEKNAWRVDRFRKYMVRERARLEKSTVEQMWEGVCWDDQYPAVQSA